MNIPFMKPCGFWILSIVLLATTFKLWGATADRGVLMLSAMILLVILVSELKEFNFWGLGGTHNDIDLSSLEGKPISDTAPTKIENAELRVAEQNDTIQLMDTSKGNFLAIAFEIERLLRIAGVALFGQEISQNSSPVKITKKLREAGLITEVGAKQIETIRWLRNMLVHGRDGEVSEGTITTVTQIAWSFYNELDDWIKNPS